MRSILKRAGLAAGVTAFTLAIVACHGQSPGGASYVPTTSSALAAPQGAAGIAPDAKRKIVSTCGRHVRIVLLGIIDCRFREHGYGNGTFTLTNDTNGVIVISPMSGTQSTTFTILGAVLGGGHFVVRDTHGQKLKVTVKVTL